MRPYLKNSIKKKFTGFTLIEITIVILLVAVCGIAMSRFFSQSTLLTLRSRNSLNSTTSIENVMEHIAQDIRQLRSSADIAAFSSTQFSFIDSSGNSNNYNLSGTSLQLNGENLLSNVGSLTFTYYDKNGNVTAVQNNIRYIGIQLQLAGSSSSISLSTTVFPRVFSN